MFVGNSTWGCTKIHLQFCQCVVHIVHFNHSQFGNLFASLQIVEMGADGDSLDVGVRIGAGSSISVEEHREQGSPMSCAEPAGFTPGSSETPTPGIPLPMSPPSSDVGVHAMEYRIRR